MCKLFFKNSWKAYEGIVQKVNFCVCVQYRIKNRKRTKQKLKDIPNPLCNITFYL